MYIESNLVIRYSKVIRTKSLIRVDIQVVIDRDSVHGINPPSSTSQVGVFKSFSASDTTDDTSAAGIPMVDTSNPCSMRNWRN